MLIPCLQSKGDSIQLFTTKYDEIYVSCKLFTNALFSLKKSLYSCMVKQCLQNFLLNIFIAVRTVAMTFLYFLISRVIYLSSVLAKFKQEFWQIFCFNHIFYCFSVFYLINMCSNSSLQFTLSLVVSPLSSYLSFKIQVIFL